MTPIYSHPPDKYLIDHLRTVGENCETVILERQIDIAEVPKIVLAKLAYIAGIVHDLGKATKNFQLYLFGKDYNGTKNHALISAFAGYWISKKWLKNNAEIDDDLKKVLPYLVFTAVKRHHGNLCNFETELAGKSTEEEKLNFQIGNFHQKETIAILNELLEPLKLTFDWNNFSSFIKNDDYLKRNLFVIPYIDNALERENKENSFRNFYIHQLLYSALLLSDKSDVILKEGMVDDANLDYNAVLDYRIENKWNNPKKDIDKKKNKAYQEGLSHLKKCFNPQQHLYSVTLPTGLGKTVTSFALALEIKKMLQNPAARIVITIPFTSIIDQNYEVYKDILKSPSSAEILKHHHLSEPKYQTGEDSIRDENESKFLIETWQSQVVVTTFVQLLECLFTNDKSKLMKLPNLANAIIILDEVQNIPYHLWNSIRKAFQFLGEQFNCYFILMSATQPLIFEPEKEIIELIPAYQDYFEFFNRTKLINRTKEVILLDDFVDEVYDYHKMNPNKNILIILNTVDYTKECFKKLTNLISEEEADLYYLSTRITPFERKAIIKKLEERKEKKVFKRPLIVVSTPLIEAGVDISVHTVFRALAPLDSIIQAAGRANRYGKYETLSEVFLYKIDELIKATNSIYGPTLIDKTEQVLKNVDEINEGNYLQLIEDYFEEIQEQSLIKTDKLTCLMCQLKFKEVGEFQFIKDRETESIFVQLNDDAVKLWKKYVALYEKDDDGDDLKRYERKQKFAQFKAQFYDFVVNIPIKTYEEQNIPFDGSQEHHFYVSKLDRPSTSYNYYTKPDGSPDFRKNTGYHRTSTSQFS